MIQQSKFFQSSRIYTFSICILAVAIYDYTDIPLKVCLQTIGGIITVTFLGKFPVLLVNKLRVKVPVQVKRYV